MAYAFNNTAGSSSAPPLAAAIVTGHDFGLSIEWSREEQDILEHELIQVASETDAVLRYAKIARKLQHKSMRDVALRVRWMHEIGFGKKRKGDPNLKRTSKDKNREEKMFDSAATPSHFPIPHNVSPNADIISYEAIGNQIHVLLEQNSHAFNQISKNLYSDQLEENEKLLCQTRDNINNLINKFRDVPELMNQMPSLNEKIDSTILGTCSSSSSIMEFVTSFEGFGHPFLDLESEESEVHNFNRRYNN